MAGSIYTDPTAAAGHANAGASTSSFWDDIMSGAGDAWDWLSGGSAGANTAIGAGAAGILQLMGGLDGPTQQPSGYQGGIPNYTYNREQLPPNASGQRPGAAGRRHFTDGTFQRNGTLQQAAQQQMQQDAAQQQNFAEGGIATVKDPRYLRGESDGMADEIDTSIDGKDPAALSHGEFVIPADIVSHLGNGNSEAGAKVLEEMMARVRRERTGNPQQGKEIDPNSVLPV